MLKKIALVFSILFLSSTLVSCGQQKPGTAAFVGDTRITSIELSTYLADLRAVVPFDNNDQGTAQNDRAGTE